MKLQDRILGDCFYNLQGVTTLDERNPKLTYVAINQGKCVLSLPLNHFRSITGIIRKNWIPLSRQKFTVKCLFSRSRATVEKRLSDVHSSSPSQQQQGQSFLARQRQVQNSVALASAAHQQSNPSAGRPKNQSYSDFLDY